MNRIQKASTDHISVIHDMACIAFPNTYRDILSKEQLDYMMEWMYSPESLSRQMTEEKNTFYIAYVDDIPAGYVSFRHEEKDIYHLEKIYVLPEYQKHKLGKALFEMVIHKIKEIHPEECEVHLNVNRNNKALHFYEHMGMRKVSEGDFEIGNGYFMNDYIMGITI